MGLLSWLHLRNASGKVRGRRCERPAAQKFRPRVHALEDRCVLSGYQQINLVGYQAGLAHFTDSNLNGWGMTSLPDGSFAVSNAFTTALITFYDRSGHVLPQTITVAPSTAEPFGPVGHPTGIVYNPTSGFVISEGSKSAPARLIIDTIDGTIAGWNPAVDPTHAIVMADHSTGLHPALYTGLEIAQNSEGHEVLYAANIGQNQVEMYDGSMNPIGLLQDPSVTSFADKSFRAWSLQAVGDKLYVTFASLKDFDGGVVDVFSTDGNLLSRFAANAPGEGPLANPWGITQAPANFGPYSNDILIGNVAGVGNINVYDPATGAYLGKLDQPDGSPIEITGLWDLEFGDGTPQSGKTNQLFFDAGPNAPGVAINGRFGVILAAGEQGGNGGGDAVRELVAPAHPVRQMLTQRQLQPVVHQALADWQSGGATAAQLAHLRQMPVSVQALPASDLGEEAGNQVWISPNAAGWGWNAGESTPTGRMDLRSVLDHEFGHALGLGDSGNPQDVMGETLAAGVRRLPRASDLGGASVSHALLVDQVVAGPAGRSLVALAAMAVRPRTW
jgi:uncharacterized protein (TIGR03118 family)